MSETDLNLISLLERAARHPDMGLRLLDTRERESWLDWSQILESARRTAGSLRALGIEKGDRVALIYPTCAEFFEAFFGALLCGAVPVPLYPPVRLGRLDEYASRTAAMVKAADAEILLSDSRVRRLLGPVVEATRPRLGCSTLSALKEGVYERVDLDPNDFALIQFSSGTTVAPKPVALSHRAVIAQALRINGFWPPRDDRQESGVSWLPLYHDMGLIGCVLPAMERPGVLTLIPPELFVSRPAVWLRTISRYRATISPAPNFAYSLCVDKIRDDELEGVDLSCWTVAMNGAEAVAPHVLRAFSARFAAWGFRREALTPVYGLSEAALAVTFSAVDRPFHSRCFDREALAEDGQAEIAEDGLELASVGRPLPDFEVEIRDQDDQPLPCGRIGRVMVRGPSLMEGYFGRPEESAKVLRNGWLDTGDLGFLHDGELFLTGRAKDLLILRGRNHAPSEVEQAIDSVAGVRNGCTVAASFLPEGAAGEVLVVLAELRSSPDDDQRQRINAEIGTTVLAACGLKVDHVALLEQGTLPRTSSGKIRRSEALQQWRQGHLSPPSKVTPLRVARALVRSQVAMARVAMTGRSDG